MTFPMTFDVMAARTGLCHAASAHNEMEDGR